MLDALHAGNRGKRRTPEFCARQSTRQKGQTRTPSPAQLAQLERLHESIRGRAKSPEHIAKLSRVDAEVTYKAAHQRLRLCLPKECAHCGETEGLLDAALIHGPHTGLRCMARPGYGYRLVYATSASAYMRLCRPCHKRYDLAKGGQ